MKITLTIKGKSEERELPVDYGSLSFRKWLATCEAKDDTEKLAILLGIDHKLLLEAEIVGLESVILLLSFLDKPQEFILPKFIKGYQIPADLAIVQTGRFKDIQALCGSMKPEDAIGSLKKYPEIVSIYAMPNYLDADRDDQDAFTAKFWDAPCSEVVAVGNFTLMKLTALKLGIKSASPKPNTALQKWRLAFRAWRASMAFSLLWYSWKKKLRSQGMNF